jgi:hypothetical protein
VLTLITALTLLVLLVGAAHTEERRLAAIHGDAFHAYVRRTSRWWPRFSAYRVPATLQLAPRVYFRAFLDAGSFVLLFLLVDLARSLRELGVFPTLFTVP